MTPTQSLPVQHNQKICLAPEVLYQRFEANALLVDLAAERVYQLNPTGARAVELLREGSTLGEALAALDEEYAALPAELERDVQELLEDLLKAGLLVRQGA